MTNKLLFCNVLHHERAVCDVCGPLSVHMAILGAFCVLSAILKVLLKGTTNFEIQDFQLKPSQSSMILLQTLLLTFFKKI